MRILLAALTFLILATLSLLTAPAVTYLQVQAQPITPTALEGPGTTLLTIFPNGSSRVAWVNGTTVQFLNGVGVLIVDPSVSAAAAASASAPVSNTVVNRIVQQLAIAIVINIEGPDVNQTLPPINTLPPIIPLPPQPNDTEPGGPDEQCLFDPSLPHCAPLDGEEFTSYYAFLAIFSVFLIVIFLIPVLMGNFFQAFLWAFSLCIGGLFFVAITYSLRIHVYNEFRDIDIMHFKTTYKDMYKRFESFFPEAALVGKKPHVKMTKKSN